MTSNFLEIHIDRKTQSFLEDLTLRLQRLDLLMDEIRELTEETIAHCFDTESDPGGSPWAALAPSTLAQRQREQNSNRKLIASGKGRRSIQVLTRRTEVFILYLDYLDFHQKGTRTLPRRQFAPTIADFEQGTFGEHIQHCTLQYLNSTFGLFMQREMSALPKIGKILGRR